MGVFFEPDFAVLWERRRARFSIVIPPPNVTGVLHMGHALNNTLARHPLPISTAAGR
jgi:valyl-tRNA synthetase